jgi:hypothetical protein
MAVWILIFSSVIFTGCRTAKKVAVTSFRVVDAPARYIRERIDSEDPGATTTTTTTTMTGPSDVTNPGYVPQTAPPPRPPPQRSTVPPAPRTTASSSAATAPRIAPVQPSPAAPRRPSPAASPAAQFPVARPVPGRPGYVYSLDPNGGMIDVTGYKPGDKAKDPYTKQIFTVP